MRTYKKCIQLHACLVLYETYISIRFTTQIQFYFCNVILLGPRSPPFPPRMGSLDVKKSDGSKGSRRAVDAVLAKKRRDPSWRGEDAERDGRPPVLSKVDHKALVALVFKERGRAKVTVRYCRQKLKRLRKVGKSTVENALHDAGLKWLRRRMKRTVPEPWKKKRMAYSRWILKQSRKLLRRFAFTDGTTFFLARGLVEADDKKRAALGPSVWRMYLC